MTKDILTTIPKTLIPTTEDGLILKQYNHLLTQYTPEVVNGFYDIVYGDACTRKFMSAETQPKREAALKQWYENTISGSFDDEYWYWQALIGIVHVKHEIPNPAMLGMWSWLLNYLQQRLVADLSTEEALEVLAVLQKLQGVICSLIVESALITQREAVFHSTGLKGVLLDRFVALEIDQILQNGRALLAKT